MYTHIGMCDGNRREWRGEKTARAASKRQRMLKSEKKKTGNNEEDGSIKRDFHG